METGAESSQGRPLAETRQATIDALCEHFANDALPVEEFERRVERAHRAGSAEDLRRLLQDLPVGRVPAIRSEGARPAPRGGPTMAPAVHERTHGLVMAVMGGATRKGHWTPARTTYAFALMGGTVLDFREAVLPPGVTQVQVLAIMGGSEIIVPPGVNVESHGLGIMGGFDNAGERAYDPAAPTVRVVGLAVMGGVDVSVRYPGESARDARRRRKLEAREERRLKGPRDA